MSEWMGALRRNWLDGVIQGAVLTTMILLRVPIWATIPVLLAIGIGMDRIRRRRARRRFLMEQARRIPEYLPPPYNGWGGSHGKQASPNLRQSCSVRYKQPDR